MPPRPMISMTAQRTPRGQEVTHATLADRGVCEKPPSPPPLLLQCWSNPTGSQGGGHESAMLSEGIMPLPIAVTLLFPPSLLRATGSSLLGSWTELLNSLETDQLAQYVGTWPRKVIQVAAGHSCIKFITALFYNGIKIGDSWNVQGHNSRITTALQVCNHALVLY